MLVLKRKVNESIFIGQNIVITVCEIHDDWIRIGIEAPREITILRAEIADQYRKEGE